MIQTPERLLVKPKEGLGSTTQTGPACKCRKLCFLQVNKTLRQQCSKEYHSLGDYEKKSIFILKGISKVPIANSKLDRPGRRNFTIRYQIQDGDEAIPVCKTAFINIIGITRGRLEQLMVKVERDELGDGRGKRSGNRIRGVGAIKEFIAEKSKQPIGPKEKRMFKVPNMFRAFTEEAPENKNVTLGTFRRIFTKEFGTQEKNADGSAEDKENGDYCTITLGNNYRNDQDSLSDETRDDVGIAPGHDNEEETSVEVETEDEEAGSLLEDRSHSHMEGETCHLRINVPFRKEPKTRVVIGGDSIEGGSCSEKKKGRRDKSSVEYVETSHTGLKVKKKRKLRDLELEEDKVSNSPKANDGHEEVPITKRKKKKDAFIENIGGTITNKDSPKEKPSDLEEFCKYIGLSKEEKSSIAMEPVEETSLSKRKKKKTLKVNDDTNVEGTTSVEPCEANNIKPKKKKSKIRRIETDLEEDQHCSAQEYCIKNESMASAEKISLIKRKKNKMKEKDSVKNIGNIVTTTEAELYDGLKRKKKRKHPEEHVEDDIPHIKNESVEDVDAIEEISFTKRRKREKPWAEKVVFLKTIANEAESTSHKKNKKRKVTGMAELLENKYLNNESESLIVEQTIDTFEDVSIKKRKKNKTKFDGFNAESKTSEQCIAEQSIETFEDVCPKKRKKNKKEFDGCNAETKTSEQCIAEQSIDIFEDVSPKKRKKKKKEFDGYNAEAKTSEQCIAEQTIDTFENVSLKKRKKKKKEFDGCNAETKTSEQCIAEQTIYTFEDVKAGL